MKKSTRNFVMFTALLFSGIMTTISGFVSRFILPGGQGSQGNYSITAIARSTFIWNRHTWMDIYDWFAVAIVVLVVVNLALLLKLNFFRIRKQISAI